MTGRAIFLGVLTAGLAGAWVGGWAQGVGDASAGKRPMTFADLQRMKRVSDPQISPSGKWVMFSVTEVDLEKNAKVNHLWVVPLESSEPTSQNRDVGHPVQKERQVTFWKEGESGGRFSPDGAQVLFAATDTTTGLSQIFLASWDEAQGKLGTPRRLTNVSTEADGAIWSPDSKRILFTSRVHPECSEGSSWLEEDNCDRRKDAEAAANPVKAQVWDHLLYRHWNSYVGLKRSHVLVVSATDGNAVRDLTPRSDIGDAEAPTFSMGGPLGYAWSPGSEEIAFVTNVDLVPAASTNNDVFTLLLDDPGSRPRKISTSLGSDDGPAYSPDGKYIAFRSQARAGYESDRFRLMLFDRLAGTTKELAPKLYRPSGASFDGWIDEFAWSGDSTTLLFASAFQGEEAVFSYEIFGSRRDNEPLFVRRTDAGEYGELQLFLNKDTSTTTVVATKMMVGHPSELVALDMGMLGHTLDHFLASEDLAPGVEPWIANEVGLTHLNDARLDTLDLSKMESFWFTGAANAKVQGFIIRPPNFDETKKYPVKFLIHGGPQGAWGDAWSYRWNAELMAAGGYVVVMVNPRGSTGYGQAFIDGVNGDWGGKAYVDLMKGLDYAEQHYAFIDKTRECALGASYGGFMANWILTHTNRFACIVTHDGMFNPQSAYGDTEELWFNEWEFREPAATVMSKGRAVKLGGDPGPAQPWNYFDRPIAQDPFRKWSPMLSIKNAKTPTLVIHSQRDYRLDVSEGFQLFTALQRLNVPSKMLYFPDEGHWILKPQNSKLWYETVGDWCDRWTKTNAYALTGFESSSAGVAVAQAQEGPTDKRVGVSRPVELDERQQLPAAARAVATPAAPVEEKAPETAVAQEAPIVRMPPTPVATVPVERTSQVGDGHASFSIVIAATNDEVQVGSDAQVSITLKNVSDHQILFAHRPGKDNPEFSYKIVVKNGSGSVVEETAYGRETRERQQNESRTVDYVQPGASTVQTAHLARLVNLSQPGTYTVRVTRNDSNGRGVVESNEVSLNIVP
jgi:dipeptidyl aminopeptidase/acylaminoacyl peptidase